MTGPEHYKAAEALLNSAAGEISEEAHQDRLTAQVHATLALVAVTAEASQQATFTDQVARPLVQKPSRADDVDPAYPGNAWGRAIYGDLHLHDSKDS